MSFRLSSNDKEQFIDSNNHLNQKVIPAINTLDVSTYGDDLTTSHRNDQDYLVAIPR